MKYRKFLYVDVYIDSMYVTALKVYEKFAFRIIIKSINFLYFLLYCDKNLLTFFYLYYYEGVLISP